MLDTDIDTDTDTDKRKASGQMPSKALGLLYGLGLGGIFHAATWVLVPAGSIAAIKAWLKGRFAPSWSSCRVCTTCATTSAPHCR
ncbi:hypothetical protein J2S59_003064 [Nocardioides massiliensis]|uniref:Uncharacterized protein n=1 Tax=Nocardioides massiliensis TaxID=1325935 RepID=A0ABT9NS54_9ACTN|nr:hypothetical protein [Nocardioides massiliensis]